jgi:hypothetical protein
MEDAVEMDAARNLAQAFSAIASRTGSFANPGGMWSGLVFYAAPLHL